MSIRLIDTGTLQMKLFTASLAPKYAILSHTWVADEEITFDEMNLIAQNPDNEASQKSGYQKILATCREARSCGVQYAWVDTCCIDKASSAELSEAINSMFRWYRDSEVCYAYLSDWPEIRESGPDADDALGDCKWFTRGWCLQELIAPKALRLYDQGWNFRGFRSDFRNAISNITRVDADVLEDSTLLESKPVARRMSWASRRVTTRVEDAAYCLLGIFDVNMPMLYGEGEKAFLRLQEEIIRRSNDASIFCHAPPPKPNRKSPECREGTPGHSPALRFCDMLAKSPEAFVDCDTISLTGGSMLDGRAFSTTNRGTYLGRRRLLAIPEIRCLGLKLEYAPSVPELGNPEIFNILLRKVGPSLFVRAQPASSELQGTRFDAHPRTMVIEDDVCVMSQVTPSAQGLIQEALARAVRFQVRTQGERVSARITEGFPPDRWDGLNKTFLAPKDTSFITCLRIETITWSPKGQEDARIYLICGIPNTGTGRTIEAPWVKFSSSDQKHLWHTGNWGDSFKREASGFSAQCVLKSTRLEAKIYREPTSTPNAVSYTCTIDGCCE